MRITDLTRFGVKITATDTARQVTLDFTGCPDRGTFIVPTNTWIPDGKTEAEVKAERVKPMADALAKAARDGKKTDRAKKELMAEVIKGKEDHEKAIAKSRVVKAKKKEKIKEKSQKKVFDGGGAGDKG